MIDTAPMAGNASRAVRPKNAATLILVRRDGEKHRILLGRRSGGHDFMPNKWVFPGGRIHPSDYRVPLVDDLSPRTIADLGETPHFARALALTAIRELFEETGLVLGTPSPPFHSRGEWRHFLMGHRPRLADLRFIARAITPPARHKRFDARFFLADAANLTSLSPVGNGELDQLAWFTLSECRALDLPTVTRAVLDTVQQHLLGTPTTIPFWRWTRNNPLSAL
ncbi:NUDIX hydrolase [Sandaracinobacteroides saxicola]|uniref:NUDIX hydrolase n=1 Tax=Sandaracinobacteroides saxicola TaxID=2759707 RepID=A0A7G5ILV1_9SPHN|nr:NUDIX hydrolase [Sandaracinobacteroides saxicola]QMW24343.1 NUDIX hydrolase [Sandaracinobacteroides saxicola]